MKRSFLVFWGILALVGIAPQYAQAGAFWQSADGTKVHCDASPCVVRYSKGGNVDVFIDAARLIKANGGRLVIDGVCISACVVMADIARPNTCVTKRAIFLLHKGSFVQTQMDARGAVYQAVVGRFDQPQSPDIDRYVRKRGGYPYKGFRKISYSQALRFWPKC